MKQTFKFQLRIKDVDKQWSETLDAGVLVEETVTFDFTCATDIDKSIAIMNAEDNMIKRYMSVNIIEVE